MKNAEVEIAELAHSILSEPEEHLEKFKEFFGFGVSKISGQENVTLDLSVRKLALLSATAVLIDIFPSLLIVNDGAEEEEATKLKKSSKEQLGKVKRSKLVLEYFDQLLQKLNKLKVSRGVSALLNSCVCSKHSLDDRRLQQLISVAVSLATGGKDVFMALRERIQRDLRSRAENLEIVRLIVQTVSRERSPERLNALVPLFEGLRFTAGSISSSVKVGEKIDRQLARDLAAGSGEYVDAKRVKGEEAQILSSIIALYVRIARAAQSGQYGFAAMKTCIQGIAMNASSVNADLALELETELLAIARLYLGQKAEKQTSGLLGAIALAALLNIAKGGNDRAEILSSSVITGLERLVPIALERLLTHSSSLSDFRAEETITLICKGAISVASQFGSDKALVSVAQALVSCLNMRFDDNICASSPFTLFAST